MTLTWPDGTTNGRTGREYEDRLLKEGYPVQEFGAVGDGVADDTAAIQAAIDEASSAATGGGYMGRPVLIPQGNYLISSPINIKDVQIKGAMRASKIIAAPGFSGGSHMLRNWQASDYTGGETDTTLPPNHTSPVTYYHQISGLSLNLGAVTNLRGIGLVHPHESSYVENVVISAPGVGSVAIDICPNLDSQGVLNGIVWLRSILIYGQTWATELLAYNGGSSLKVDNWSSGPGAHSASVFDILVLDCEINRFHCEAFVDLTSVDTDLASIRFRSCAGAAVLNSFWTSSGANVYKHPFIYADNASGSGNGRNVVVRDLKLNLAGSYDAAVPLIRDESNASNPQSISYAAQAYIDYTANGYEEVLGTTGVGTKRMLHEVGVLTYAAFMAPDASRYRYHTVTITNATALQFSAPTKPTPGRKLTLDILNSSGGAHGTITMNATYKLAGGGTTLPAIANTKRRTFSFYYDGTSWIETHRVTADI